MINKEKAYSMAKKGATFLGNVIEYYCWFKIFYLTVLKPSEKFDIVDLRLLIGLGVFLIIHRIDKTLKKLTGASIEVNVSDLFTKDCQPTLRIKNKDSE